MTNKIIEQCIADADRLAAHTRLLQATIVKLEADIANHPALALLEQIRYAHLNEHSMFELLDEAREMLEQYGYPMRGA